MAHGGDSMAERNELEVFLQGAGVQNITLIRVPQSGSVADILSAGRAAGLVVADDVNVYIEDDEVALSLESLLSTTPIRNRSRVHVNRCRRVDVNVSFNGRQITEAFPPATTMKRVKRWAVGAKGFNMSDVDAAEHVLQLSGSAERPDEDIHIGTLVTGSQCVVSFDLVPKVRVEG